MPNLLLQSCSASKKEIDTPAPAFDLYTGYFYKILKKAIRENEIRSDIDILILSAKHGILNQFEEITHYDQRMDASRAKELNKTVVESVTEKTEDTDYDRIVINMGKTYRDAISGLNNQVEVPLVAISGTGIGEKGQSLHQFIRGDDSALTELTDV